MNKLFNAAIEELPGLSFDCRCGRRHSVEIEKLVVRSNIMKDLVNALMPYRSGKLFILTDTNTYNVFGRAVITKLEQEGFRLKPFTFESKGHDLIPDERAIGRLLTEIEPDTSLILAVGSGVLNDLSRFVGFRTNKPFMIAGTAPSMDGYASVVSPLIVNGRKLTFPGKYPSAIFADTSIMSSAPMVMIRAGFGDVLGKLTALADWNLSRIMVNEYYCETTAKLVQKGVDKCIESAEGLAARDETAIGHLIEALILTGISMGLVGVSRPASGTEHQLAHYWEVRAIEEGRDHPLHGNEVGVGTVVTAMLYELAAELLPGSICYPSVERVLQLLRKVGACTKPQELGVSRELFIDSMMNAMYQRDKYTILRFCHEKGKLSEFTEIMTRRLYD